MLCLVLALLFTVEHATTPQQIERGLMGRKELPENHGMLFHFPNVQHRSIWMWNCYIDLDVAFLDEKGTILQIGTLKAHPECKNPARFEAEALHSKQPVAYALEMPAGWFATHHIQVGEQLNMQSLGQKRSH